jgi:cephalosporin-C deacetylase
VGYLTLPPQTDDAREKRWPCLIRAPGYGGELPPFDMSSRGLATFAFNVRGQGLSKKLHQYKTGELLADGIENPATYYYRFVYTDFVRAVEYLASRPDIDPDRIGISGASQGASISLAVAALSPRIKFCAAVDPGFCGWEMICDLAYYGYGQRRIYGYFPDLADKSSGRFSRQDILRNLSYFDIAFLCQWIACPTVFVNDHVSYPETTAVAFYNIPAKDKVLIAYPTGGHCFTDDKYQKAFDRYLKENLGGG